MHALINGGNIHWEELGAADAPSVVFLHGFPFSLEMWRAQMELVAANGFRALAYDIRGHGMSDVGDGQFTIESHVDDLFALLDELKIGRTVIVGLSMGGYITLRALERSPERFLAAVLCDTRSESDTNEGRIRRAVSASGVKKTGSAAFAEDFVKAVFAPESVTRSAGAIEAIRRTIARTTPLSIAGTLIALAGRSDTTAALAGLSLPTLILVGEKDITTPPAASAAMHERIRGSELHIVPGAAHMSNLENPQFFNEKLLGFLRRLSASR